MALKAFLIIPLLLIISGCYDPCQPAHFDEYYTQFCYSKEMQPMPDGYSEGIGFSAVFCINDNSEMIQFSLNEYLKNCSEVDEDVRVN